MIIREEREDDFDAIRVIVAKAFKDHPFSNQREPLLIDALRRAGALTIALVAEEDGAIAGHIAFSPVQIGARFQNWYGLGPLAISPEWQRAGIGQALVRAGLVRLAALNAGGCVVLGDPVYYCRFGFAARQQLQLVGAPPGHFMSLAFSDASPLGAVTYHDAFSLVD